MNDLRKAELNVACDLTELARDCRLAALSDGPGAAGLRELAQALEEVAQQMRRPTLAEVLDWARWRQEQQALTVQKGTLTP